MIHDNTIKKVDSTTSIKEHSDACQVSKIPFIGTIEQAESYLQDNEDIHRGYRINYNDWRSVIVSLFECHNETVNVWTHLCGILMFIALICYILGPLKWNQHIPQHDLTKLLVNEIESNEINFCMRNEDQLFLSKIGLRKCFVDHDFYENALEYWIAEVEEECKEYFSSDLIQHWHSLLKQEYPKTTFNGFFLLEKDPYIELLKQFKHFLILLDMIETDNIDPHTSIDTVSYLSYTIRNRIRAQLDSCLEIMTHDDAFLSPEERTLQKMVKTYKILLSTLHQHFTNLLERISKLYRIQIDLKILLNSDDVYDGYTDHQTRNEVTVIPLILHMMAAITCLGFSSIFHLCCCHCYKTFSFLSRFDYGGITILIGGSTIPPYIYTFYCGELWYFGLFYTICIDTICLIAFIICLIPSFDTPKYRGIRAILFVIVGLASGLPGLHVVLFRDPFVSPPANVFLWALGGAVYISGAVLYASRFPEKFFPGKLCYIGQSHNIWHCFVLTGAIIHFFASLSEYQTRTMFPCLA